MLKRTLLAAALTAPAFVVGGAAVQPASAEVSAPCTTAEQRTPTTTDTSEVRCRWRDRYGNWCKYCYKFGKWRLQYCRDYDDHDDDD
jgi:hypothetical protein